MADEHSHNQLRSSQAHTHTHISSQPYTNMAYAHMSAHIHRNMHAHTNRKTHACTLNTQKITANKILYKINVWKTQ